MIVKIERHKKTTTDLAGTLSGEGVTDVRRGAAVAAVARQTAVIGELSVAVQTAITTPPCDRVPTSTCTRSDVALRRDGALRVTVARLHAQTDRQTDRQLHLQKDQQNDTISICLNCM